MADTSIATYTAPSEHAVVGEQCHLVGMRSQIELTAPTCEPLCFVLQLPVPALMMGALCSSGTAQEIAYLCTDPFA